MTKRQHGNASGSDIIGSLKIRDRGLAIGGDVPDVPKRVLGAEENMTYNA